MPVFMNCLDNGLTLLRQPSEYWAGNYAAAREGNPWYYKLMATHPLAFIGWEAASIAIFVGLILLMPQTLALAISIAFTLGYMVGASTWLLYGKIRYGHELFCALCLFTAVGMALGIRWGWGAVPPADAPLAARTPWLRVLIIAALCAMAIYMHLWPR